jgi:hypothetical protein
MRLRYIQLDPEVVTELPNWTASEIERESETTLTDLGIARQENESYLLAWVRTMLAENGCDDNRENRQRLLEAIREDRNAQLFVWILGGKERKAFGLEDSPAFQERLARFHAERSLVPGASYDHDDRRYWEYQHETVQASHVRQPVSRRGLAQTVLGMLVATVGAWAAPGLGSSVGWRLVDFLVLLIWIALAAAGTALVFGLVALMTGEPGHHLRWLGLWVAVVAALAAIGLHMYASWKLEADATQSERWIVPPRLDEKSVEELGYVQQIKRVDHLGEHRRDIYWFVKIPATNKLYSCSWESGFAGFAKDDAVKLIHRKPGIENGDYSGFVVGLHGAQAGRSASVWALDVHELEMLDLDDR